MNAKLVPIEPEYVYITIPAEYICVYHRILAMLADYGEDMLKDCKAACKDRNSSVIDCFNMFNAAVAARKLGKDSLANALITYIKAKINQIYKGEDNSTSFVFPVDENGQIKAFVSCGERPQFEINPDDAELYVHKFGNGFEEHFHLGPEDGYENERADGLSVIFEPSFERIRGIVHACAEITVKWNGNEISLPESSCYYYFDSVPVVDFKDVTNISIGEHTFSVVAKYADQVKIITKTVILKDSQGHYEIS